jgi:secreted Zn-dependent insulinase-like peptidase
MSLCSELPEEAKAGPRIYKDIDPPRLVVTDPIAGRLWHRLDDRYALPKASLTLLLRNAAVSHSKVDGVWTFDTTKSIESTMLSSLYSQAMAQETYDASLAGLGWSLSTSNSGISVSCSGYLNQVMTVPHFSKNPISTQSKTDLSEASTPTFNRDEQILMPCTTEIY